MTRLLLCAIRIVVFIVVSHAQTYPPVPGDWGYYVLSSGGSMFYWFMSQGSQQKAGISINIGASPKLMIILDDVSSVGVGNIAGIGPYDLSLSYRNITPLSYASLLFIDAPIGTGWSYASSGSQFSPSYESAANDVIDFLLHHWFPDHPSAKISDVILYCSGNSAQLGILLARNWMREGYQPKITDLILASPSISPQNAYYGMTEYLLQTSNIEEFEKHALDAMIVNLFDSLKRGNVVQALAQETEFLQAVQSVTHGTNLNNILAKASDYDIMVAYEASKRLLINGNVYAAVKSVASYAEYEQVMEGPVRRFFLTFRPGNATTSLLVPQIKWGSQYEEATQALAFDQLRGAIPALDELLINGETTVTILTGQLDASANTIGLFSSLKRLTWSGVEEFFQSRKDVFLGPIGGPQVFRKVYDKLAFYVIERSGSKISIDVNPEIFSTILKEIVLN